MRCASKIVSLYVCCHMPCLQAEHMESQASCGSYLLYYAAHLQNDSSESTKLPISRVCYFSTIGLYTYKHKHCLPNRHRQHYNGGGELL